MRDVEREREGFNGDFLFEEGCEGDVDGDDTFFGYAIINNDLDNAEWGYISFAGLKGLKVPAGFEIDCEVWE